MKNVFFLFQIVCWSPKGKQLVVGKSDGSLAQYDQHLVIKKDIACPTIFDGKPMTGNVEMSY